jgi:beta-glucosidase
MSDILFQRAATRMLLCAVVLTGCVGSGPRWSETESGTIRTVTNRGGQTLGYVTTSGVSLLTVDGFAFKDLSKNGALDPYEDWRLSADERAKDLASKMSVEQIAGLMLYSAHQAVPGAGGRLRATYDGKPFPESGANAWDLSDAQKDFLTNDNLRHVLITSVESPEVAARWDNNVQALVEGIGLGIPSNNSSDPRHNTQADAEYNAGSGASRRENIARSASPRPFLRKSIWPPTPVGSDSAAPSGKTQASRQTWPARMWMGFRPPRATRPSPGGGAMRA